MKGGGSFDSSPFLFYQAMKYLYILILLPLALNSCDSKRPLEWNDEIADITNKNLDEWLRKSPFTNEWIADEDPDDDYVVLTNHKLVFPMLGEFKNEDDDLIGLFRDSSDFYNEKFVLYKDSVWGDSYVFATLMYEYQPLYKERYHRNSQIIGGSQSNSVELLETNIAAVNDEYRTAIYWVETGFDITHLHAFYQRDQLVFEMAFPCTEKEAHQGLNFIKETGDKLGLSIPEWIEADTSMLKEVEFANRKTIWRNYYVKMYNRQHLSRLKIKIEQTPYRKQYMSRARKEGVDMLWGYENDFGIHKIGVVTKKLSTNQVEFEASKAGHRSVELRKDNKNRKVFYQQAEDDGMITGSAEMFFLEGEKLMLLYTYPKSDSEAFTYIMDIFINLKVNDYQYVNKEE